MTTTQQGFTLIELSIVLVIIGLIIGGVLVGQEMIAAAQGRAQISQIEKYNTAVNTFQTKYGGIPGDLNITLAAQFGFVTLGCAAVGARDGNGLIDGLPGGHPLIQAVGETGLFWQDLSTAGFLDTTIPNNGAAQVLGGGASPVLSSTTIGQYLPSAKIGGGNFLYVYEVNGMNWYGLSTVTSINSSGQLFSNTQISVTQAYNLDKKIDDGMPTTGIVQAVYINGGYLAGATSIPPSGSPDTASTCYNNSTNTYSNNVNKGSGPNCALSFKMQGQAR